MTTVRSSAAHDVTDLGLAAEGVRRIEWAEREMPVLRLIRERFERDRPLDGLRVGACLHVTTETANLMRTLKAGGAQVVLNVRADNPPALNAYRRLGFAEHTRFEERLIHRLGSPWPDVTASLRRLFTRKETDPR